MGEKMTATLRTIIFALLAALALSLSSCATLARAFADQMGRNIADTVFDK
jgi:starvation-inducible outer membrane lipoprotein